MRIVFFGTAPFAIPALERLHESICLVVSQPAQPTGRGLKLQQTPVGLKAEELGIPLAQPEKCRAEEFVQQVRDLNPDVLLVAAYGQIMPVRLLETGRQGAINLHGSILPAYRGAAPIQRAVANGDSESGVTLMQMDKGMDTGDIIAIERTPIDPDETAGELYERLAYLAADMAEAWMPRIVAGDYTRIPQNNDLASHAAKMTKEDAQLDFTMDARQAYNRMRSVTPVPGAFIRIEQGILKIREARLISETAEPGTVLNSKDRLVVAFSGGSLEFRQVQPEGKRAMAGPEFANGARIKAGMRLLNVES